MGSIATIVALAGCPPASQKPRGVVRDERTGYLVGCAIDDDVPAQSIYVHLYVKVPESDPNAVFFGAPINDSIRFLQAKFADRSNANLNQQCPHPASNRHGYRFIVPPEFRDGQPHTYYVWAIDNTGNGGNTLLAKPGNPTAYAVNITAASNLPVIGALDDIRDGKATGWVIDPDTESTSTSVHIYVDGPAGQGTYIGQALADQPRADLADWGFAGNHAFEFTIPPQFVGNTLRAFWTHGIDTGGGPNYLVDPLPKEYARGDGAEVLGPAEVVYDYSAQHCPGEIYDLPDLPARAWKDANNQINLVSGHLMTRIAVGPDFKTLVHDCSRAPDMVSSYGDPSDTRPNEDLFNRAEWLAAPYTPDGTTVYGLVHNEYHGEPPGIGPNGATLPPDPAQCPSGNSVVCWYNSITAVVRNGIGQPFVDPPAAVSRLVATLPYRYDPSWTSASGYRAPSNIHHNIYSDSPDSYYYVLVDARATGYQLLGACLLRTDDLADPARWRAMSWDGSGFTVSFVNPYAVQQPIPNPWDFMCEPVMLGGPGGSGMHEGLTWNTFLGRFLVVNASLYPLSGSGASGFWYATANDLRDWGPSGTFTPRLIMRAPLSFGYTPGGLVPFYSYAALIDHADDTRNFEKTGQIAYLYTTRTNDPQADPLDRDLVRFRVRFLATP